MLLRMISRQCPPQDSHHQADDGRQIKDRLPAPVHHDPGCDRRGDGRTEADAADGNTDPDTAGFDRHPVRDSPIERGERDGFSQTQRESHKHECADNSKEIGER